MLLCIFYFLKTAFKFIPPFHVEKVPNKKECLKRSLSNVSAFLLLNNYIH